VRSVQDGLCVKSKREGGGGGKLREEGKRKGEPLVKRDLCINT